LERYVPVPTPTSATVHTRKASATFHSARQFVLRYGSRLILEALRDMFTRVQDFDNGPLWRCWRPEIKSPARYLNWSVRELAELARRDWEDGNR
jgi:hypothetical protein